MTIYILIENPSKGNNLGSILRCATAFGVTKIVTIGYDQCAVQGSHGASKHVELVGFPTLGQAQDYLESQHPDDECTFLGLVGQLANGYNETDHCHLTHSAGFPLRLRSEDQVLVPSLPDTLPSSDYSSHSIYSVSLPPTNKKNRHICLVMSKHHGLPRFLAQICHTLVHVPYEASSLPLHDSPTTCLFLDTPIVLSIVLHHIRTTLVPQEQPEQIFQGNKFQVDRHRRRYSRKTKSIQNETTNNNNNLPILDHYHFGIFNNNNNNDGDY